MMSNLPINHSKLMLSIILVLISVHSIISNLQTLYESSYSRNSDGEIYVISVSKFPHLIDDVYQVVFSQRASKFPYNSIMIVNIMGPDNEASIDRFTIYPSLTMQPYNSDYFKNIESKLYDNQSIVINIRFKQKAHNHILDIRYGEYDNENQMNFAATRPKQMVQMYSMLITLIVRTELKVKTLTLDGRDDGVSIDEDGYCYCKGIGGLPFYRARLDNLERFELVKNDKPDYEQTENVALRRVRFKLENHGDKFLCYTENSLKVAVVNVFHHPTKIYLEPRYYNSMPNGSQVVCVAEDGYPMPEVKWEFVKGPANKNQYYKIHKEKLFMLKESPIGSEWEFRCIAENIIPSSQRNSTSYLFKFTIVNSNSNVLVLAAASIGSLIALLALLVGVFLIVRPNSGARNRSTNRRRQNNSNRADSAETKELGFDPDTLINSTKSLCDSTASGLNTKPTSNTTTPSNTLPKPIQPMKSILVNSNANQKDETKLANQNATSIPLVTTITTTNHTSSNNNANNDNNKINNSPDSFGAPAYDEITADSHGNVTKPPPPLPTNRLPYQQQMAQNSISNNIESSHTTMTNDSDNNNSKIISNKDEIYDQTTKDDKPASYV